MASTHVKTFYAAEALTAASSNSSGTNPHQVLAKDGCFIGFFKAASVDAATTVSAKIQHSPNNVEWYDLITFTDLVGASGDQHISVNSVTTHVFQHIRGVVELAGATLAATCTIQLFFDR